MTKSIKSERGRGCRRRCARAPPTVPRPHPRTRTVTAEPRSSMQGSIAISIATFRFVFACSPDISTVSDLLESKTLRFRRFVSGYLAVQAVQSQYFPQPIRVVSGQYGALVTVQYRVVSQYGHPDSVGADGRIIVCMTSCRRLLASVGLFLIPWFIHQTV